MAFRSHIAFEMARTRRPDVIVATACHDRLIKALRNVPDIPALLAPLAGMEKPCRNAGIDLVLAGASAGRAGGHGTSRPGRDFPLPGHPGKPSNHDQTLLRGVLVAQRPAAHETRAMAHPVGPSSCWRRCWCRPGRRGAVAG